MTINTESDTTVTGEVRQATETPLAASKKLSRKLTGQKLPSVDLTQPVARYLAPLQKGVDLNRHLASQGAELLANVLRHLRGQAHWVRSKVNEQTDPADELSNAQAERETAERETAEREQAARETADRETAEREEAERNLEVAKRTLEAAKRKREAARRKREEAERTLEAAKLKREQAERETAEREQAERDQG